jgi:hypothetical protein
MSQCDPNNPCELCAPKPNVVREKMPLANRCGRKNEYKSDGEGNPIYVICDRRSRHNGKHRGRVKFEEFTEKLFW